MSAQTGPETQILWTQLLPLPTIRPLGPRNGIAGVPTPPSLLPSDKAGTTLRLLLQDTQCSLEKFSTRLDTLFLGLEQSNQSISRAGSLLEDSRDAVTTDVRTIVASLREDIQSIIGTPAQVQAVSSLGDSLSAMLDAHLQQMGRRVDTLDSKIQAVIDQQTQLLAALGAVATLLPLTQVLRSMPTHSQSAVKDVQGAVDRVSSSRGDNQQGDRKRIPILHDSPACGSKKRRRVESQCNPDSGPAGYRHDWLTSKETPLPRTQDNSSSLDCEPTTFAEYTPKLKVASLGATDSLPKFTSDLSSHGSVLTGAHPPASSAIGLEPLAVASAIQVVHTEETKRADKLEKKARERTGRFLAPRPSVQPSQEMASEPRTGSNKTYRPSIFDTVPELPPLSSPGRFALGSSSSEVDFGSTSSGGIEAVATSSGVVVPARVQEFRDLDTVEDEEGNVSLDMDFLWGSLPEESSDFE